MVGPYARSSFTFSNEGKERDRPRNLHGGNGPAVGGSPCIYQEDSQNAAIRYPNGIGKSEGGRVSSIGQLKRKWQSDPEFQKAYDALKPEFAVARQLIAARNRAGLSQAEVARRMGTTQSGVARLESGHRLPAMNSLRRYASAIGHRLEVRLVRQV
jgi:DNA-binding XRE family transcriptional regulator